MTQYGRGQPVVLVTGLPATIESVQDTVFALGRNVELPRPIYVVKARSGHRQTVTADQIMTAVRGHRPELASAQDLPPAAAMEAQG